MHTVLGLLKYVISWPVIVFIIILIFYKEIKELLKTVIEIKTPFLSLGRKPADSGPVAVAEAPEPQGISEGAAKYKTGPSFEDKPGNLFWAGYDLMWTVNALISNEDKTIYMNGLDQAAFHIRELGLAGWIDDIKAWMTSNEPLTKFQRKFAAVRLNNLAVVLGRIAEGQQEGYRAGPELPPS